MRVYKLVILLSSEERFAKDIGPEIREKIEALNDVHIASMDMRTPEDADIEELAKKLEAMEEEAL